MMPAWAAIVPDLVPADEHARRDRAQQHRHQRVAGDRSRDRRRPGGGGRAVAGVRAERAVLYRHPRGAAAVAARAPQEHAAGRALPERDSRRHALRHAHARAAGRAHPRQRILRVRQRDVVAVSADRAPGARARPGNLRPAAHLHRRRCGRRGDAAAARARKASRATCWSPGASALYALAAARARARAERRRCWRWRCSRRASPGFRFSPRCRCPRR